MKICFDVNLYSGINYQRCFNEYIDGTTHEHHRNIQTTIDALQSTVTGIPSNLEIINSQPYTIIVTAKDSSGSNIGSGGESIYLHITDHCTRGVDMICNRVTSSSSVLGSEITAAMVDHTDGTYSYILTVNSPGNVSIQILLANKNPINGTIYDTITYGTGTPTGIPSSVK